MTKEQDEKKKQKSFTKNKTTKIFQGITKMRGKDFVWHLNLKNVNKERLITLDKIENWIRVIHFVVFIILRRV